MATEMDVSENITIIIIVYLYFLYIELNINIIDTVTGGYGGGYGMIGGPQDILGMSFDNDYINNDYFKMWTIWEK